MHRGSDHAENLDIDNRSQRGEMAHCTWYPIFGHLFLGRDETEYCQVGILCIRLRNPADFELQGTVHS
jgi:hypothetical protein